MSCDAKSAGKTLKQLKAAKKAAEAREQTWRKMTAKRARRLSDETLWDCLFFRLDNNEDTLKTPGVKRTLYTAMLFDVELPVGGLCSLCDDYPEIFPYLEDALAAVGAEPYLTPLQDTLARLGITLEQFVTTGAAELLQCGQQCEEHCPLEALDDGWYGLISEAPLMPLCIRYARARLQELF
ncbi:MAG: hypothetical protein LUD84_08380 [Clostridiales bacterium]|nr:hypothetical protein [Clostridiales bacterium]